MFLKIVTVCTILNIYRLKGLEPFFVVVTIWTSQKINPSHTALYHPWYAQFGIKTNIFEKKTRPKTDPNWPKCMLNRHRSVKTDPIESSGDGIHIQRKPLGDHCPCPFATRGKVTQFCLYAMTGTMSKFGASLRIVWSKCSTEGSLDSQKVSTWGVKACMTFSSGKYLGNLHWPPLGILWESLEFSLGNTLTTQPCALHHTLFLQPSQAGVLKVCKQHWDGDNTYNTTYTSA